MNIVDESASDEETLRLSGNQYPGRIIVVIALGKKIAPKDPLSYDLFSKIV